MSKLKSDSGGFFTVGHIQLFYTSACLHLVDLLGLLSMSLSTSCALNFIGSPCPLGGISDQWNVLVQKGIKWTFFTTGHSLGGFLATVTAIEIGQEIEKCASRNSMLS